MTKPLFFDNASTTRCCEEASQLVHQFAEHDYGNPSSSHSLGQQAARAIRDARIYFAGLFGVEPPQVIFTGSGSESDNMAIYGVALDILAKRIKNPAGPAPRVLCSAVEHPAVRKTMQSLTSLGFDVQLIPVDKNCQIDRAKFFDLLTPETVLVSIQRVNNIVGSLFPVEDLARLAKERVPGLLFHTDAVQAFGRVELPKSPSAVDLVSVSAHKVEGPKGVGALILLNKSLLKHGFRPLIWGGEQEGGFRSGTQNAGLIAGFHKAAEKTLAAREAYSKHTEVLRERLRKQIADLPIVWNSPEHGNVPHIVSLSFPGYPSGPLAKLLEERGCLVSTGSACSSQKAEPDPVLSAMGLPQSVVTSAIRVSFSSCLETTDVDRLAGAIRESVELMKKLLGG